MSILLKTLELRNKLISDESKNDEIGEVQQNIFSNIQGDFIPDISKLVLDHRDELMKAKDCGCRMNNNLISIKRETSYICRQCPDKLQNLCQYCIESCHKNHRGNTRIELLKHDLVNFQENPCQCALHNHKITPLSKTLLKEDSNKNKESKLYCHFNLMFSWTKPKYIYKRRDNKKYYCLYCMYNYFKQEEKPAVNIAQGGFMGGLMMNLQVNSSYIEDNSVIEQITTLTEFNEAYEVLNASNYLVNGN